AIDFGLIGFCFLCFFLFGNLYLTNKNKDSTGFLFFLIVAGCCIAENFLIRNMGVNLVVIFAFLIFIINKDILTNKKR
ncbi:MAG: hypothetical protein V7691_08430, partial [Galbibacter orientalis]|uniref:hypothetical protein n=1 Tax=Galbibacter orientalis TaxID=453852 RepID=UPI003002F76C